MDARLDASMSADRASRGSAQERADDNGHRHGEQQAGDGDFGRHADEPPEGVDVVLEGRFLAATHAGRIADA